VEAVTSQNYVLHMVNPVTTVERAITMQDVANQLLNRKFMQLVRKKMRMKSSFVDVVCAHSTEKEEWIVPIEVNQTTIPFKLDTDAHVNLLSFEDY